LANSAQAKKRALQAEKRRQHNVALRSRMRTYVKRTVTQISAGEGEQAGETYRKAVPLIDSMVTKGLIHKNKAARHKSRLNSAIKALGS